MAAASTDLRRFRAYTAAMLAVAAVVVAACASDGWSLHGRWLAFAFLAACVLIGELLPVQLPRGDGLSDDLTLSAAFALAVTLLFGVAPGVAVYAGACLVGELVQRPSPAKVLFNVSQCTVVMGAAAGVFAALAGHGAVESVRGDAVPMLAAVAAFFVLDTVLTGMAIALVSDERPLRFLRTQIGVHAWTEASLMGLTPVIVAATREATWLVPLLLVPTGGIFVAGRVAAGNWYRALYDEVTGLPNRALLTSRVGALAEADSGGAIAVAAIAVDGLKAIGDALGTAAADEAVALIARRLSRMLPQTRDTDTLARVAPYEFALAARVANGSDFAAQIEPRLAAAFATPFQVGQLALSIRAHAGVAVEAGSAADPADLLARAAHAAEEARALGRPLLQAPAAERQPLDRLILAGQLQRGIARGELVLEYQPKQALREGLGDAVEALVRWRHPELGTLGPQAFVPLAEQTGLIGALTRWVAGEAIRQCAQWQARGFQVRVAVNVSARDLVDESLLDHLELQVRRAGLAEGSIQLEVTESQLLHAAADAQAAVERLRRAGIACAIDDFGTGYSSLTQLHRLAVDEIKIDRSFVDRIGQDSASAVIVESTIALGRSLGVRVTAEGVEDRATLERLIELGCDYAQGFHIGKPMTAEACYAAHLDGLATGFARLRRFRGEIAMRVMGSG